MDCVINRLLPGCRDMIELQQRALPPAKVLPGRAATKRQDLRMGQG